MKLKIITILFFTLFLLFGCVENSKEVKIQIKQIIPITPTTYIEVSKPLNLNLSDLSVTDKTGTNTIDDNKMFVIPVKIENKLDQTLHDTKIHLIYNPDYIEFIYPYSAGNEPFESIGDNFYNFDSELLPSQDTTIFLVGKPKSISGLEYVGLAYTIELFVFENQQQFQKDVIEIHKS